MYLRAQFSRFGGPEVVEIAEIPDASAEPSQVRVRVHAAALNPADTKMFRGAARGGTLELPAGLGIDFFGEVVDIGASVTGYAIGDRVVGAKRGHALAEFVTIDADDLLIKAPAGLSSLAGAALANAGRAAWASVRAVDLGPKDVVLISAAAGGVGSIAVQLARRTGAAVIGTASPENHAFLRGLGARPLEYGEGLRERLLAIADDGLTAALDYHDSGVVDLALDLGVRASRINSLTAHDYRGVTDLGSAAASAEDLAALAGLVADGEVVVPLAGVYSLQELPQAYARLEAGHVRGKLVVDLAREPLTPSQGD